jgi:hypothetical protein
MRLKVLILALGVVAVTGCNTVTIRAEGSRRLKTTPTYDSREDFFLWRLAGESHIDVPAVFGSSPSTGGRPRMSSCC